MADQLRANQAASISVQGSGFQDPCHTLACLGLGGNRRPAGGGHVVRSERPGFPYVVRVFAILLAPGRPESEHETQKKILDCVKQSPGIRVGQICQELHANRGTVSYHLRRLEKCHLLESRSEGRATSYFLPESDVLRHAEEMSELRKGHLMEVAIAVNDSPGIPQKDLRVHMSNSRKVIREQLDRLLEKGLIEERKETRWKKYYPTPLLGKILGLVRRP